jgi:hypothetical protein
VDRPSRRTGRVDVSRQLIGVEAIGRHYYLPIWRYPPEEERGRMLADGRLEHMKAKASRRAR